MATPLSALGVSEEPTNEMKWGDVSTGGRNGREDSGTAISGLLDSFTWKAAKRKQAVGPGGALHTQTKAMARI